MHVVHERGTKNVYALKILRKDDMLSQQNVSPLFSIRHFSHSFYSFILFYKVFNTINVKQKVDQLLQ